jgi:hypothetical protein
MSNTNKVIDMITREALRVAHETPSFLKTINMQYDDQFKASNSGKGGSTLRIREPVQFDVADGRVIDIQDAETTQQTLTVATQKHVAFRFNSAELTTDIEDISERYIAPATKRLIAKIEADVLQSVTKDVYQVAGLPGTVVGAGGNIQQIYDAMAKINQQCAPDDPARRRAVFDSATMAKIAGTGVVSLFHDASNIKSAFTEGRVLRTAFADIYTNEKTWTMPNAADVQTTLDTYTIVEGDTDITVASLSAAAVEGMVFTLDGVYDVHPETKDAYSHLKQFVVTSASTTVVTFTPAIRLSGAKKNVAASNGADLTVSSLTTTTVNFFGSASTSYRQNLMYDKDAFTLVMADLPLFAGADKCQRGNRDGFALRVWVDSDIKNDEQIFRMDALYGYLAVRPEWACRISN